MTQLTARGNRSHEVALHSCPDCDTTPCPACTPSDQEIPA